MLKRNVVLGSLIASAFLLPAVASAGVVQGRCDDCHTMHNSQGGVGQTTAQAKLLKGAATCVGCHAAGVANDGTTGKRVDGNHAPQVLDKVTVNPGGYFSAVAGDEGKQHNIAGIAAADSVFVAKGNRPGDSAAYAAAIGCADCHTQAGHHTSTAGVYRMLGTTGATASTAGAGNYSPNAGFPGNRSQINYAAAQLNSVCAACHPDFHGTGNTGAASPFTRHPTNVKILGNTATSVPATITATDAIVVGDGADQTVMCLSCHVAHGGPNSDLLSFTYGGSGSYAGDNSATGDGCETCHAYGAAGM